MSGPQRYNFEELREQINKEIENEHMPEKLYKSTDEIMRVINAIIKTKGQGWAAQVLNDKGNPILNEQEQIKFTQTFQPYLESIIDYFGTDDNMSGGADTSENIPSKNNLLEMASIDDVYSKIVHKIGNINSTVNKYASKYGILKLEKDHDTEPDIRFIPDPAALAISEGIFALSTSAGIPIPTSITMKVLTKIKVPFRTIIFTIYLALDIARLSMGIVGPSIGRKIMSILLAILELLRGDWKKAVLTLVGYYGMMPMLIGELLKVFLTLFKMFSPQIQYNIIFGSLDATKSIIIGLLLAIFQVTAPEEVRLPLIDILGKIAQRKAQSDDVFKSIGLSARPTYLSPTWQDLNNIQAVMSDDAYICSCEFKQLVDTVNKSAIIRVILEILRIPVNNDMIIHKCGKEQCKDFVTTIVTKAKQHTDAERKASEPISINKFKAPVDLNPDTSITAPVNNMSSTASNSLKPKEESEEEKKEDVEEEKKEGVEEEKKEGVEEEKKEGVEEEKKEGVEEEKKEGVEEIKVNDSSPVGVSKQVNKITGGRILHSRLRKSIA
jgi:hypothetical protein